MKIERQRTDILILGGGGAGLFAALHAKQAAPEIEVTMAVKGLAGKCGCTRMVQGGYNVALAAGDSLERHFMDTIVGGKWLPRQDLAWRLVEGAVERVRELENELGCFFDRNADGSLHQKAFAGQSFDRTVHKGDLTGIEIVNRLMERVLASEVRTLEDHRAIELIPAGDGAAIAGVLFVDMRTGGYRLVQAKAVLLGTGGGPTMYRYHTPSGDKSCDGMAMALRLGLRLRDMEMVQFHPTGLLAGEDTRLTGTVLEEGLRGAGGWLVNGDGERFMQDIDPAAERATRDIVARAIDAEMRAGRTTPMGGVYLAMNHLGPETVTARFPGMVKRCADSGFDLAGGRVEVVPTAHYMMGGVEFEIDGATALPGLYAAGEDCGGVHGANRLGGNGVANATVFGGIAGDSLAAYAEASAGFAEPDETAIEAGLVRAEAPFTGPPSDFRDLGALRDELWRTMWEDAGVVRDAPGLARAAATLEELRARLDAIGLADTDSGREFDLTWHDWLNLDSLIAVSRAIVVAATARENSRGAHWRTDFPDTGNLAASYYTSIHAVGGDDGERVLDANLVLEKVPVEFTIVEPGQSLIADAAGAAGIEDAAGAPGPNATETGS